MDVTEQQPQLEQLAYKRSQAYDFSNGRLGFLLETIDTFLQDETLETSTDDLGWIEHDDDLALIENDPRITAAQRSLDELRSTAKFKRATEVSRCTEWRVLFEKFVQAVQTTEAA